MAPIKTKMIMIMVNIKYNGKYQKSDNGDEDDEDEEECDDEEKEDNNDDLPELHLAATVSSNSACSTGSHKATRLFSVLCSDNHFDYDKNNGKDHDMDL